MADFTFTGSDGKKFKVTGDTQEGAIAAFNAMQAGGATPQSVAGIPSGATIIASTDDGGRVYQMQDGAKGFVSPNYSTTDPARIDQIMQGATGAETSRSGMNQDIIAQHPVAARGVKFVEGTPFVGSYLDEGIGMALGDDAKSAIRATSQAMSEKHPVQSGSLNLGGAVMGSVPIALAAAPTMIANAPATIGGKAIAAGVLSGAAGGLEGAIYGAGEGEGVRERAQNTAIQGGIGLGAGTALGVAAPYAAAGIKHLVTLFQNSDLEVIARELGVSKDAAKVIKSALDEGDMNRAVRNVSDAGPTSMVADAGQPARELLDASMTAGGRAGEIGRDAVETRASAADAQMNTAFDKFFGPPRGVKEMQDAVRIGTSPTRKAAYEAAYAVPIDYSTKHGRQIEALMPRVPKSAIDRANALMRVDGDEVHQIMASIDDAGKVTYQAMPDVRQIDYITRALNDVAAEADGKGKLGGQTQLGRAYAGLSTQLRTAARSGVKEYGHALNVAGDAIREKEALDFGYAMLPGRTKREDVARFMRGAEAPDKAAVKSGIRSYIDDTLANVRSVISDPNQDAREAIKGVTDMRSRASRHKMQIVLGKKQSDALMDELDMAAIGLELRAAVAGNSKTAIRTAIKGTMDDITAPGVISTLAQGEPVHAMKRIAQALTGQTPEAVHLRQLGLYQEISAALTGVRGNRAANALRLIDNAMDGQELTDKQAQLIGAAVASTFAQVGGQQASRRLGPQ